SARLDGEPAPSVLACAIPYFEDSGQPAEPVQGNLRLDGEPGPSAPAHIRIHWSVNRLPISLVLPSRLAARQSTERLEMQGSSCAPTHLPWNVPRSNPVQEACWLTEGPGLA